MPFEVTYFCSFTSYSAFTASRYLGIALVKIGLLQYLLLACQACKI